MFQIVSSALPLWQFEQLTSYNTIAHYVSGRSGGVSEGELSSLNISYKVNDSPANVQENRRRLAAALAITPQQLFFPAQTHSINVQLVDSKTHSDDLGNTDALITHTPGLCISVMSADCVPVLLYDPVKKAVAAIHAGWRGTVGKIVTETVAAMQNHFGTNPADLIAGIGPSICPQVYEVGPEVVEAVADAFGATDGLVANINETGKGFMDLWAANKRQLLELGTQPDNIEVAGICTYGQHNHFFSARHSHNRTGRFAAGIMLR